MRLFDVYTGAQVGEGRKSLAYKLTFRAPDRTLTVEEAVAARDAAVSEAAVRVGATLRGGDRLTARDRRKDCTVSPGAVWGPSSCNRRPGRAHADTLCLHT